MSKVQTEVESPILQEDIHGIFPCIALLWVMCFWGHTLDFLSYPVTIAPEAANHAFILLQAIKCRLLVMVILEV
jgi:hypothetical protein